MALLLAEIRFCHFLSQTTLFDGDLIFDNLPHFVERGVTNWPCGNTLVAIIGI